jgi:hypothetical protein
MNVAALVVVGLLALVGLVAGMVQRAAHINARQHGSLDAAARPDVIWDAEVVIDPITGEALDALTDRERQLGQLDHGAESFALHTDIFDEYHAQHREETARAVWNAGFDWYIEHINAQFDALLAGLPTTGEDPFDQTYWPPVSAAPVSVVPLIERLATFSPDATIQIVEERNAVPTVFSWTTHEHALVGGHGPAVQVAQSGQVTLVRERGPRHRRRR